MAASTGSSALERERGGSGVRCELDASGAVATVTLDRPEVLNAQTPHTWAALHEVSRNLPGTVRVVIVRGAGRAFSAGLDRAMFTPQGVPGAPGMADIVADPDADAVVARFQEAFRWLRRPDLISVAAVHGHAIGAGFQLALACDLRILTEEAQLCMAETGLGLVPDLTGTKPLVELVGYARALEICVTSRRVSAAEAARIGLANLVVPADHLDGAVADLVAALLAAPRDAVVETKALLAGAAGRDLDAQCAAERAAQLRRFRDLAHMADG